MWRTSKASGLLVFLMTLISTEQVLGGCLKSLDIRQLDALKATGKILIEKPSPPSSVFHWHKYELYPDYDGTVCIALEFDIGVEGQATNVSVIRSFPKGALDRIGQRMVRRANFVRGLDVGGAVMLFTFNREIEE